MVHGYESIRQSERHLPNSSYNHNKLTTFRTSVRESLALRVWKFLTADSEVQLVREVVMVPSTDFSPQL